MMQRVRQFVCALMARVSDADEAFVAFWLSGREIELFHAMTVPDQAHALRVAHTALALAKEKPLGLDERLLVRCALLHDVGRRRGDMGTAGKVLAVLMRVVCPGFSRSWAKEGARGVIGRVRHALYVYWHHAQIGARELERLGLEREAGIVARHHEEGEETGVLGILKKADDRS